MLGKKNQVQKHIRPGKMLGQKRFESGKKNSGPRIRANLPRTNVTCTFLLIYGNLRCFDKFQLSLGVLGIEWMRQMGWWLVSEE